MSPSLRCRAFITMQSLYRILANAVLALHFAFILFVLFGGLLALRLPRAAWVHLPALFWGIAVEWADWICPLTPLENALRLRAGQTGYESSFIEFWIAKILYPQDLTLELRYALGLVLAALNVAVYADVILSRKKTRRRQTPLE